MLAICLIIHHTKSLIGRRGRCVCLIQQAFRGGVKDLLYASGICFSNCRNNRWSFVELQRVIVALDDASLMSNQDKLCQSKNLYGTLKLILILHRTI